MRSLAHELMHHTQKCNGEFDNVQTMGEEGYAQNDMHLRKMEIQAYKASIVFRDWEDSCKGTIYYEHLQKGEKKMSTKDWKNKEISGLLAEAWGFKFNTLEEFNEFNGEGEIQEEEVEVAEETVEEAVEEDTIDEAHDDDDDEKMKEAVEEETVDESVDTGVFAPNHYCIHHGGVNHNGQVELAEAIQHVEPDENGHISHYDMKLSDGTVLENVAAEDIQVTNASLALEHGGDNPGKRDDKKKHKAMKKKPMHDHDGNPDTAEIPAYVSKAEADAAEKKKGKKGKQPPQLAKAQGKKPTKEQIEALVKKALQEALQNRKG